MCKVAIATEEELVQCYTFPHLSLRDAGQILSAHPSLEAAIYSSVARVDKPLLGLLSERLPSVVMVDEHTAVPLEVAYDRKRLGSDRLAAVVGAYSLAPRRPLPSSVSQAQARILEGISPQDSTLGSRLLITLPPVCLYSPI